MASVRDLVEAGLDEGLVKQAVDASGFERKRGRGGLDLDAKGVAKVVKAYLALLAKLTTKASKVNLDKLGVDEPVAKPKVEKADKKPAPKPKAKAKPPVEEDDEEDEPVEESDADDDSGEEEEDDDE
jgi:hypothetical protein